MHRPQYNSNLNIKNFYIYQMPDICKGNECSALTLQVSDAVIGSLTSLLSHFLRKVTFLMHSLPTWVNNCFLSCLRFSISHDGHLQQGNQSFAQVQDDSKCHREQQSQVQMWLLGSQAGSLTLQIPCFHVALQSQEIPTGFSAKLVIARIRHPQSSSWIIRTLVYTFD